MAGAGKDVSRSSTGDDVHTHCSPLLSLPPEILDNIVERFDRDSLLAFDRVSRATYGAADRHVWTVLKLWLPFGDGVIQSDENEGILDQGEKKAAEDRRRADLEAMLAAVWKRGEGWRWGVAKGDGRGIKVKGGRQWRKVRAVSLDPKPGAIRWITKILRAISPNLAQLELFQLEWLSSDSDHLHPTADKTLDVQLLKSKIQFPSLTKLVISNYSIHFAETINLLSNMAPNLVSLEANLDLCYFRQVTTPLPSFPALKGPTKLRSLTVDFGRDERDEDTADGEYDQREQAVTMGVVLGLVAQSPDLEYLRLYYRGSVDELKRDMLMVVNKLSSLREFSCGLELDDLRGIMSEEGISLPNVRTLTLDPSHALDIFTRLPTLPHVESLFLRQTFHAPAEMSPNVSIPDAAGAMVSTFATQLRNSPRLRVLYTRWKGHKGGEEGFVRSYRHGDAEILYARLLLDAVEVSDLPFDYESGDGPEEDFETIIGHTDNDGNHHDKTFIRFAQPVWQSFTDLGGRAIPLEVLEEMRGIEGLSEEEWARRGVQVGGEAWNVVMKYLEEIDEGDEDDEDD